MNLETSITAVNKFAEVLRDQRVDFATCTDPTTMLAALANAMQDPRMLDVMQHVQANIADAQRATVDDITASITASMRAEMLALTERIEKLEHAMERGRRTKTAMPSFDLANNPLYTQVNKTLAGPPIVSESDDEWDHQVDQFQARNAEFISRQI